MLLFLVSDCMLIESPFLETRAYELISMALTRQQALDNNTKLSSSSFKRVNILASSLPHRLFEFLMSYVELLMSQLHNFLSFFYSFFNFERHKCKENPQNFIPFCSS